MSIPGSASPLFLATAAAAAAPAGHQIDRSLRFNSSDSAYLSRTPSSAGNRRTFTFSCWVKRNKVGHYSGLFGGADGSNTQGIYLTNDDEIYVPIGGQNHIWSPKIRDLSAWYHIVTAVDTTQSTNTDRIKTYINGVALTSSDVKSAGWPSQDVDSSVNNTGLHTIGRNAGNTGSYGEYYLTEVHFVDGTALAATDFGEEDSNGVWQPKAFSGTYGTNGFYLKFADASSKAALGTDSSGNSNTWDVHNLTAVVPTLNGVSFDGSGDRLVVADDADLAFGTGEFTVEMYFICDTVSGNDVLYDSRAQTGSPSDGFSIVRNGNQLRTYSGGAYQVTSSTTLSTGQLYHLAVTRESTTQKMYLDGTLVGSTTLNYNFSQQKATIGSDVNGDEGWDGFISNVRLVKGTAVYTANFTAPSTALTNVTNTVLLCCQSSSSTTAATVTPGTITAHGNVAVATEYPGQGPEGIDSLLDTPTNYTAASGNNGGNYATLNPLDNGGLTLSNGNLTVSRATNSWRVCRAGIGITSGKYYWEYTLAATTNSTNSSCIGIAKSDAPLDNSYVGETASGWAFYSASGQKVTGDSWSSYGSGMSNGDTIGVAFDADNGTLAFYQNGSSLGNAFTGLTSGPYFPAVSLYGTQTYHFNFGQRPFAISSIPTGYKALCTQNLDESAYASIPDGSTAFDISLWTGNSTSKTISGLNHSPDLVWIKARSFGADPELYDIVRGTGKRLFSSLSNGESTPTSNVNSFNSDGFSVTGGGGVNNNNSTYVGWTWDAGTSTVSNTDGSITSSVRASQASGFSIVSWTGTGASATIGHGLNAAPEVIIVKCRSHGSTDWPVYHSGLGAGNRVYLSVNASSSSGTNWNSTSPTSSVFSVGNNPDTNGSSRTYVAYCISPVAGYSAVGSYTGNGLTDGPFVFTGFKVRWLMYKRTDAANSWQILDTARDPMNVNNLVLFADLSNSESTGTGNNDQFDMLSNGFKVRSSNFAGNASGGTYIYVAFAEHPLRTARAR